jgi:hypothetical protein
MKTKQHDVVTIKATVELAAHDALSLIIKDAAGGDARVRVPVSAIIAVEAGPIRAGDIVVKGKAKSKVEGEVIHRVGDKVWAKWVDGTESVEDVGTVARA